MNNLRTPEQAAAEAARLAPSPRQWAWQELEFIAFAHFTMNTFTEREWGDGDEDPALFNPTAFDADQWARVCQRRRDEDDHPDRQAPRRLLPVAEPLHRALRQEQPLAGRPGRRGARAGRRPAARQGSKFGIYLSPWDRNAPTYGTAGYNDYYKDQLRELLTSYGQIGEVWFDGACGEGPNGKRQVYDWAGYYQVIRELQPGAAIAISGPDVRWVGNEGGVARETEWSVAGVNGDLERPAFADWNEAFYNAHLGDRPADVPPGDAAELCGAPRLVYWPSEVDVSIRPGWFYHAEEDLRVHSLERLVDIYYRSAGRNDVLLLNLPPDRRGLIHEHDAARLAELRSTLDGTFSHDLAAGRPVHGSAEDRGHPAAHAVDGDPSTCWQAPEGVTAAWLEVDLGGPVTFNRALLQEMVTEGQRIASYVLEAWHAGQWKEVARGTTVGRKKLDRFGTVIAERVRLRITSARARPALRAFGLYRAAPGG